MYVRTPRVQIADQQHRLWIVVLRRFAQPLPRLIVEVALGIGLREEAGVRHLAAIVLFGGAQKVVLGAFAVLLDHLAEGVQRGEVEHRIHVVQVRRAFEQRHAALDLVFPEGAGEVHRAEVGHRRVETGVDGGEQPLFRRLQKTRAHVADRRTERPFEKDLRQNRLRETVVQPRRLFEPSDGVLEAPGAPHLGADEGLRRAVATHRQHPHQRRQVEVRADAHFLAGDGARHRVARVRVVSRGRDQGRAHRRQVEEHHVHRLSFGTGDQTQQKAVFVHFVGAASQRLATGGEESLGFSAGEHGIGRFFLAAVGVPLPLLPGIGVRLPRRNDGRLNRIHPALMPFHLLVRFNVAVEPRQRLVPSQTAVVDVQNRGARSAQPQRFVLQRHDLPLEQRDLVQPLVEVRHGQQRFPQRPRRHHFAPDRPLRQLVVAGQGQRRNARAPDHAHRQSQHRRTGEAAPKRPDRLRPEHRVVLHAKEFSALAHSAYGHHAAPGRRIVLSHRTSGSRIHVEQAL